MRSRVFETLRCPSVGPLLLVCCCVPGGQEIDRLLQQLRAAGECGQWHVVSVRRKLNTELFDLSDVHEHIFGFSDLYTNCTCRPPWIGPPLAALRYVMQAYTSGFMDDVISAHSVPCGAACRCRCRLQRSVTSLRRCAQANVPAASRAFCVVS